MIISVFDRVENIVGKGENAGHQHFLLFPQCFEKAFFQTCQQVSLCGNGLSVKSLITGAGIRCAAKDCINQPYQKSL